MEQTPDGGAGRVPRETQIMSAELGALDSPGVGAMAPTLTAPSLASATRAMREYAGLISHWATKVNLVSVNDLPYLAQRHILPALSLRAPICAVRHANIVDVGSGAGLPAIPLAITLPESQFTLVESRRRRVNFLRHVVRQLRLTNVQIVGARIEAWRPSTKADIVLSRAVTDAENLARLAGHCLAPSGLLLVTTGPRTANRYTGLRAVLSLQDDRLKQAQAFLAQPDRESHFGG